MGESRTQTKETAQGLSLARADIVILANAHNPSIVSPEWLHENCGIDEKPKKFVHTPDFSLFDSEALLLVVDQARMQIVSHNSDDQGLNMIAEVASKYITVLEHVPYAAIGFNYVWNWLAPDEEVPQLSLTISGEPVPGKIDDYSTACGGIIYGSASDHRMKLMIEAPPAGPFVFNFNFHFDVNEKPFQDVAKIVGSLPVRKATCESVIHTLLGGE
jgi:hypothetical protein